MSSSILCKKSVCVITGASRGLGKSIATTLASQLPEGSLLILLSRNQQLLDEVALDVTSNKGIHSVSEVFHQDSTDQEVFDNILQKCLDKAKRMIDVTSFEQAILVNNAGSLEPDFIRDLDDLSAISAYMQCNIVGSSVLTSKFLQTFTSKITRVVINISSLAAISPMKSWSLYCMAKAARDIQMKVLGEEETNIRTLNYAPGPLRTEMINKAAVSTKDPELKKWINDNKDKTFLETDESAQKLLTILKENSFENGAHVDYYD